MRLLSFVYVFFMLLFSPVATSALVDQGTITFDESTGLRWLDLTESFGWSYADIAIELEDGGEFEEYRRATFDEIVQLFVNAGIEGIINDYQVFNYQPIVDLTSLIYSSTELTRVEGIFADNDFVFKTSSISASLGGMGIFSLSVNHVAQEGVIGLGSFFSPAGHFLVAELSEVPVPASIWLFFSGILGLGFIRQRRECLS